MPAAGLHIPIMEKQDKPPAAGAPRKRRQGKEGDGAAGKAAPRRPGSWPVEHGGPKGPEPTRYGDWEKNGRCTDF